MAQAVVTLTLNNTLNSVGADMTKDSQILNGVASLTAGGTYLHGGLPLTWTGVKDSNGAAIVPVSRQSAPYLARFESIAGSGYTYQWNQASGTLQIFAAGSQSDLATGTAVPVDTIAFQAFFQKG